MIRYYLTVLLAVIGGSTAVIFGKISTAPSMVLVVYRMVFASLLLSPVMIRRRKEYSKAGRRTLLAAVLGGVSLGLHFSLFFQSLKLSSAASCSILCNTQVVFVAILSAFIFRKKYRLISYAGVAIALIGACIMALADSSGSDVSTLEGDAFALGAAVALAVYTLISSFCRKSMDTSLYTTITYPFAALTAFVLALISGNSVIGYEPINLLAALGLTVFCTFLGHSLFSFSLKYLSPSLVSTMQLLDSAFSVLWGIIFFGEIPTLMIIVGGIISVGGVLLFCLTDKEN